MHYLFFLARQLTGIVATLKPTGLLSDEAPWFNPATAKRHLWGSFVTIHMPGLLPPGF